MCSNFFLVIITLLPVYNKCAHFRMKERGNRGKKSFFLAQPRENVYMLSKYLHKSIPTFIYELMYECGQGSYNTATKSERNFIFGAKFLLFRAQCEMLMEGRLHSKNERGAGVVEKSGWLW
jgi:hypothetical protein